MTGVFGRRLAAVVAVGSLVLGAAAPARAGFMGSTATSQYYAYGGKSGAATAFAVDGQAHAATYNTFDVTVTSTQIVYDFHISLTAGAWSSSATSLNRDGLSIRNGNLLTFAGAPTILDVTIDPSTTMAGLTAANLTFNGDSIAIDWMGKAYSPNARVVLNVALAPVSEPPALAMAGLAALGLAATSGVRRRRGARVA